MRTRLIKIGIALNMLLCITAFGQIRHPYGNDFILENPDGSRWEAQGNDWDCRYVTYSFENGTDDVGGTDEHDAVRRAFVSWSQVARLDFIEVCTGGDIRVSWETDDHGDDDDFDGPFGVLAHAFSPLQIQVL